MNKFIDLRTTIKRVVIVLGYACNFSCKYCFQKNIINDYEKRNNYNKDIIEYIKVLHRKNNLLKIHFYGGEPLLYFDIIKNIVLDLKDLEGITFSLVSNGSLLTKEIADFVNKYHIHITFSWDGRNTESVRGYDIFKNNLNNIFLLSNGFDISSGLSSFSYPKTLFDDINKFNIKYYMPVYGKNINFNVYWLFNIGYDSNSEAFSIDYEHLSKDIEYIFSKYRTDINSCTFVEKQFVTDILSRIQRFSDFKDVNSILPKCESGRLSSVSIDLEGNFYLCKNDPETSRIYNIYSSYEDFIGQYRKFLVPYIEFYKNNCYSCFARFLCKGGCMLLSDLEKNDFYCNLEKTIFNSVIKGIDCSQMNE